MPHTPTPSLKITLRLDPSRLQLASTSNPIHKPSSTTSSPPQNPSPAPSSNTAEHKGQKKSRAVYGTGSRAQKRREKERQQAITAAAQALGGTPTSTNGLLHQKRTPLTRSRTPHGDVPPPGYVHNPKLGPKANLGAINAGLRALDRTGKPCRKWHRTSLTLKTLTGREWSVPGWSRSLIPSVEGIPNGICEEKS